MDIAIIDDGVCGQYIKGARIKLDLEVTQDNLVVARTEETETGCRNARFSHGTVCAAIISRYEPNAAFISIKVMDPETGRGDRGHLIAALEWCLAREPMIIHLSIGTVLARDFERLKAVISSLYQKGFLIVAAYSNAGGYTVPASMECVVGVKHRMQAVEGCRVNDDLSETFAEADSRHELDLGGRKYVTRACNSYAAPYVTAMLHSYVRGRDIRSINDIWFLLSGKRKQYLCAFPDFIREAAVIDVSEDEWPERFCFRTVMVTEGTAALREERNLAFLVVLADQSFCLQEMAQRYKLQWERIKGIFCCWKDDRDALAGMGDLGYQVWFEQHYLERYASGAGDPGIDIPVIYVYGKRSRLIRILPELKKRFLEDGYDAGIVGQFPRAYLYGFSYIDCTGNRAAIIGNLYRKFQWDVLVCGIDSHERIQDIEDICFNLAEGPEKSERVLNVEDEEGCADMLYREILRLFS